MNIPRALPEALALDPEPLEWDIFSFAIPIRGNSPKQMILVRGIISRNNILWENVNFYRFERHRLYGLQELYHRHGWGFGAWESGHPRRNTVH